MSKITVTCYNSNSFFFAICEVCRSREVEDPKVKLDNLNDKGLESYKLSSLY